MVDFTDLDELPEATKDAKAKPAAEERFTCMSCAGTGVWKGGYINPQSGPCFSCGGKGWHKKPHAEAVRERRARGAKMKAGRERALAERQEALREEHGDLIEWLNKNRSWNSFAQSLMEDFETRAKWSDKQIAAAQRMVAKTELKRAEKAEARTSNVGDVSAIHRLFDRALEQGKNKRALLAANYDGGGKVVNVVKLTPARPPRTEVWVKVDGEFSGGIDKAGKFKARHGSPSWLPEVLQRLADDPEGETRLYGRRTGVCSCCGRELTDPESVRAGIGPICATNYGL